HELWLRLQFGLCDNGRGSTLEFRLRCYASWLRRLARADIGSGDLRCTLSSGLAQLMVGRHLNGEILVLRARLVDVRRRQRLTVSGNMLCPSVREEKRQLVTWQPRPGSHAVRIHVNERNGGCWIIANAAALANESRITELAERYVREMHVRRLAEHVPALLGLPTTCPAKHLVGRRRPVAGNDVDGLLGAELSVNL